MELISESPQGGSFGLCAAVGVGGMGKAFNELLQGVDGHLKENQESEMLALGNVDFLQGSFGVAK